jgi:hypothetical protein
MLSMQKFLRRGLKKFIKGEEGLVTVEWISLVAAVVVGGIAIVWAVMDQAGGVAKGIGSSISAANTAGCTAAKAGNITTAGC